MSEENNLVIPAGQFEALCKRIATMAFDLHVAELLWCRDQLREMGNEATAYWLDVTKDRIAGKRDIVLQDVVSAMWQHELAETTHKAIDLRTKVRDITEAGITVYPGNLLKEAGTKE